MLKKIYIHLKKANSDFMNMFSLKKTKWMVLLLSLMMKQSYAVEPNSWSWDPEQSVFKDFLVFSETTKLMFGVEGVFIPPSGERIKITPKGNIYSTFTIYREGTKLFMEYSINVPPYKKTIEMKIKEEHTEIRLQHQERKNSYFIWIK